MSVRVRLQRRGAKKRPFYSIVASDKRSSRDGKFIEKLGYYDATREPSVVKFDVERLRYWFGIGAELSDQVANLAKIEKIPLERVKTHVPRTAK